MGYQPIENYGIIGNMRTAALVGMNGSIDWYCSPHFDSPSVFGAILDDEKGGRFQIVPVAERVKSRQFYWPSTNILVTRFLHEDGITELEDFMPVGLPPESKWYHHLYRRIRCVRGTVKIRMVCRPRVRLRACGTSSEIASAWSDVRCWDAEPASLQWRMHLGFHLKSGGQTAALQSLLHYFYGI